MISVFGDIPQLIKNEDYFQNAPTYVTEDVFSTPLPDEPGLTSLHQHQCIEISYVESGTGIHRIWNESYPVTTGDLYVLNVAVPHGFFPLTTADTLHVHSLYFDLTALYKDEITEIGSERYLFGLFSQNNFAIHLSLKPKQRKSLYSDFNLIKTEIAKKQTDWQDALYSRLTLLLLDIKRMVLHSKVPQQYHEMECTPLTARVFQMIQENYADPAFSLKNVADALHKSSSSISRSFYDITGKHFSDYLISYRMQQAAVLVTETELSNEEIATQCGYRDFPFFYKQFKEIIGTTPGEWRKQAKYKSPYSTSYTTDNTQLYEAISENLQLCQKKNVLKFVTQALDEGLSPKEIIRQGLVRGMDALGTRFQTNEVFILEVVSASKILNSCMEILRPHLVNNDVCYLGKAVICTVKGDLHDVGKNLVKIFLESKGIQCIDLGVNVSPQAVVEAVQQHRASLVCLSALLSTTMMVQKDVIDALKAAGIRDTVKVMVGGPLVTQDFSDSIGADCYTPDATTAANEAVRLLLDMSNPPK